MANTISRSLHDVGLAAWFGGTLANAVALNAAAAEAGSDKATGAVANAGLSTVKTLLTAAALGVTAYSRVLGKIVSDNGATPSKRGTKPSKRAKGEVAAAQAKLDQLQWAIPAITGALVVVTSYAGEQQRPAEVLRGIAEKNSSN
jgi:hypothetical protein